MVEQMTFDEFDSLLGSLDRLRFRDTEESAWTTMVSTQGSGKELDKWLSSRRKTIDPEAAETSGKEALLRDFGKGI